MAMGGNPAAAVPQGNVYDQSAWSLNQAQGLAAGAGSYRPATVGAPSPAGLNGYMNPYTQSVTNQTMADLDRQRQMATNDIGAQATAAGAFGGSRHGVAEAQTNAMFGDIGAQTYAGLNQQGFNTALGMDQTAQLANQQAGLAGANLALGASGQLGNLSNLGFGMGNSIAQQQMQQGGLQQAMQQALIDAGKGQWQGLQGAPAGSLAALLGGVNGSPGAGTGTSTTTMQPGLFNYLALGLGL